MNINSKPNQRKPKERADEYKLKTKPNQRRESMNINSKPNQGREPMNKLKVTEANLQRNELISRKQNDRSKFVKE